MQCAPDATEDKGALVSTESATASSRARSSGLDRAGSLPAAISADLEAASVAVKVALIV